jgi:Centrosomal spindle body, CEP44
MRITVVYSILRDEFNYKPSLSRTQFFSKGFSERKCMFISDVVKCIRELSTKLNRERKDASTHTASSVIRSQKSDPEIARSSVQSDVQPQNTTVNESSQFSAIIDNPPSRFISEQAWYNHVARSVPHDIEQPSVTYPVPQTHPLENEPDQVVEDSVLVDYTVSEEQYVTENLDLCSPLEQKQYFQANITPPSAKHATPRVTPKRGFEPAWKRPFDGLGKQLDAIQNQQHAFSQVLATNRRPCRYYLTGWQNLKFKWKI